VRAYTKLLVIEKLGVRVAVVMFLVVLSGGLEAQ